MAASSVPPSNPVTTINVPWPQVERFVGLFTHDVRNGLNAIELQLTLLSEVSDDLSVKEEVKRIRTSLADVTRQLHAVRVATGALTPHPFPYPAVDFAEDLRERFERQHGDDRARIRWEIEAGGGSLAVDPELSMAALLALLDNALFFAADGSSVQVRVNSNADGAAFTIRQSLADPVAEPTDEWGRTPLSSTRRDGYGLGAFRARRIVEAQQGALRFAYSEADRSLVTTVVLPVTPSTDAVN